MADFGFWQDPNAFFRSSGLFPMRGSGPPEAGQGPKDAIYGWARPKILTVYQCPFPSLKNKIEFILYVIFMTYNGI